MTRQQALNRISMRLIWVFVPLLAASALVLQLDHKATVLAMLFLVGNIGSYVSIHKDLGTLSDIEVIELSSSLVALIAPSLVGGILAILMYVIFLSGIFEGALFPNFLPDSDQLPEKFTAIFKQHAEHGIHDNAKLIFWGFIAGYNQKYVVDLIESVKTKS
mgnify:CR=1 FL=1